MGCCSPDGEMDRFLFRPEVKDEDMFGKTRKRKIIHYFGSSSLSQKFRSSVIQSRLVENVTFLKTKLWFLFDLFRKLVEKCRHLGILTVVPSA